MATEITYLGLMLTAVLSVYIGWAIEENDANPVIYLGAVGGIVLILLDHLFIAFTIFSADDISEANSIVSTSIIGGLNFLGIGIALAILMILIGYLTYNATTTIKSRRREEVEHKPGILQIKLHWVDSVIIVGVSMILIWGALISPNSLPENAGLAAGLGFGWLYSLLWIGALADEGLPGAFLALFAGYFAVLSPWMASYLDHNTPIPIVWPYDLLIDVANVLAPIFFVIVVLLFVLGIHSATKTILFQLVTKHA